MPSLSELLRLHQAAGLGRRGGLAMQNPDVAEKVNSYIEEALSEQMQQPQQ